MRKSLGTAEGWHVLHAFYRLEPSARRELAKPSNLKSLEKEFISLVRAAHKQKDFQILTFSMVGHKADIGFMVLSADLVSLHHFDKQLAALLAAENISATYSYLSMTETSEYTTSPEEHAAQLEREEKLKPGSPEFEAKLKEFKVRMEVYLQHRLYPQLPPWPVVCFYPMCKRRSGEKNWYMLNFETRKKLMEGHARVGRRYSGKILQLITGSTGLDEWEWGVTLFAHDLLMIKQIVYEMRFDEVSAAYADFGDFYVGLQVQPKELISSAIGKEA